MKLAAPTYTRGSSNCGTTLTAIDLRSKKKITCVIFRSVFFFFDEVRVEGLDAQLSNQLRANRAGELFSWQRLCIAFYAYSQEEKKSHMDKSLHCDFSFYASFSLRHIRVAGENKPVRPACLLTVWGFFLFFLKGRLIW